MGIISKQMSIFDEPSPFKYIIDTSAILSQKPLEKNRRTRFRSLWNDIDELVRKQVIVVSSEIMEEINDQDIKDLLIGENCKIIEVDEEIQTNVSIVVSKQPHLIDFKQNKSSGDAFLIATAIKYRLTVITEENRDKPFKIPKVCELLGVDCIDILGLCELEDWKY